MKNKKIKILFLSIAFAMLLLIGNPTEAFADESNILKVEITIQRWSPFNDLIYKYPSECKPSSVYLEGTINGTTTKVYIISPEEVADGNTSGERNLYWEYCNR